MQTISLISQKGGVGKQPWRSTLPSWPRRRAQASSSPTPTRSNPSPTGARRGRTSIPCPTPLLCFPTPRPLSPPRRARKQSGPPLHRQLAELDRGQPHGRGSVGPADDGAPSAQAPARLAQLEDGGWCPGAESNHRHTDFQSVALPTELPGRAPRALSRCARAAARRRVDSRERRPCPATSRGVRRRDQVSRGLDAPLSRSRPRSSSSISSSSAAGAA